MKLQPTEYRAIIVLRLREFAEIEFSNFKELSEYWLTAEKVIPTRVRKNLRIMPCADNMEAYKNMPLESAVLAFYGWIAYHSNLIAEADLYLFNRVKHENFVQKTKVEFAGQKHNLESFYRIMIEGSKLQELMDSISILSLEDKKSLKTIISYLYSKVD